MLKNIISIISILVLSSCLACQDSCNSQTLEISVENANSNSRGIPAADSGANEAFNFVDSNEFRKAVLLDTTFSMIEDSITVRVSIGFDTTKHINIPEKYVGVYGLENFHVNESYSRVTIFKNYKLLQDTVLTKRSFASKIDSSLMQYGNLMFPNIYLNNNQIEIHFSLSVPMTDVGVPVSYIFPLK